MRIVLLTALGVGGASVMGAILGFAFKKISHHFSDLVLAFAAGVMLCAAVVGLILGTVSMAVLGSAFNAIYLLPKFSQLFGLPLDAIIGMGAKIHGSIHSVPTFVMLCVAPLNVVKGVMVSVPTMLLYKRVARPLFGIRS